MRNSYWRTVTALLLALCMVFSLAACGKEKPVDTPEPDATPEPEEPGVPSAVNAPEVTYISSGQAIATATNVDGDFVPVLRFAVTSDIHTRAAGVGTTDAATTDELTAAADRTAGLFRLSYEYAAKSAYTGLDAVMVVGDYTDYGRTQQYEAFLGVVNEEIRDGTELLVCLGNHEFWDTRENGTYATDTTKTYARFEQYFGHSPDSHVVIGGYHFIGVAPDCNGGRNYSEEKADWLATQLRRAAADDPTGQKPIFVYQHIAPANTVYGSKKTTNASDAYAAITLDNALKNYPQAVVFAGHSHRPVTDPVCIMQKDYTVLNTGTLAYGCYEIYTGKGGTTRGMLALGETGDWYDDMNDNWYEHGERECSIFTLIEIDAAGRMRVQYIDADNGCLVDRSVLIDTIGQRDDFSLTIARAGASEIPYFASDAQITVASNHPTALRLSFPQAICRDTVRDYKVEVYRGDQLIDTVYRFSNAYFSPVPTSLIAPITGLKPLTTYQVKIYAYNAWGKLSQTPLTGTFTTMAAEDATTPDVFSLGFLANGAPYDVVSGENLVKTGRATTAEDETLGRTVGVFNGSGDYQWRGLPDYTEMIRGGFTYELYLKIDTLPRSGYVNPSSAMQNGGFGFEVNAQGELYYAVFSKSIKGYNAWPIATAVVGEYVHLVGVCDGENVYLYVNGELAASEPFQGNEIFFPVKPSARYLSIGSDAGFYYESGPGFTGRIAAANLYSTPLTAAQAAALYAGLD